MFEQMINAAKKKTPAKKPATRKKTVTPKTS